MDAATLNTVTMPAPLAEANKDSAPPEVVVTKKAKVDEETASPTKVENVAPPPGPPKGEAPVEPAPVGDVPMEIVAKAEKSPKEVSRPDPRISRRARRFRVS